MASCLKKSKKISVCILSLTIVMLLFLFTSCKSKENPQVYDVERDGKIYTVDLENQTIAVDDYICSFELSDSNYGENFTVTYPDGSTYWWGQSCGGWSDDFDPQKYVEGDVLWEVLTSDDQNQGSHSGQYFLIGIILILTGAIHIAAPRGMWYISYGWRYKNAEPSDMALFVERAGGIFAIIIGVICLFV